MLASLINMPILIKTKYSKNKIFNDPNGIDV